MHNIIKWFAPIVTIGVAIFIVAFTFSINISENITEQESLTLNNELTQKKIKKNWLNNFANTEQLGYYYPVNEVYIKLNLDKEIKDLTKYKFSASILDPYQLFCLKEELKNHNLQYYLKKDKNSLDLIIYSEKKDKLNSLVKVLKNYQILAIVEPYNEEKK